MKKLRLVFNVMLAFTLIISMSSWQFSSSTKAEEGVINNPGFEDGIWDVNHPDAVTLDTDVKHSGEQSAKLTSVPNDSVFLMSNLIEVNPERLYQLKLWMRAQDVTENAMTVRILEVNEDNAALGWHGPFMNDGLIKTGGTHDWQQFSFDIKNINSQTAFLKIYLWMNTGAEGEAWVDDLSIETIARPGDQYELDITTDKIGNVFREGETIEGTMNLSSILSDETDITLESEITDKEGDVVLSNSEKVSVSSSNSVEIPFTFDADKKGVYYGSFKLIDANGDVIKEETTRFGLIDPLDAEDASEFSPFGAQTHFGQYKGNPDENLPLMSIGGMKWTRDEMYWSIIESEKGNLSFPDVFDEYVEKNTENGMNPIMLLNYGNANYDANSGGEGRGPHTEEGLAGYENYVTTMVERYKDHIQYWEVWNEPNHEFFWGDEPNPREYAAVLKTAYNAIKRVDPDAKVIGASMAGTDLNFLRELFDAGALAYMDILAVHPYRSESPEETNFERDLYYHQDLMKEYGYEKPVWLTEIGWRTSTDWVGVTEEEQAQYLTRMYVQSLSTGFTEQVNWYEFQDGGPDPANNEHRLGIVTTELTPKQAYTAYSAMVNQLQDSHYVGNLNIGDNSYGEVFIENGKPLAVLWALDEKQIELSVSAEELEVVDIDGNTIPVSTDNSVAELTIGPDPIYVKGIGVDVAYEAVTNELQQVLDNARSDLEVSKAIDKSKIASLLSEVEAKFAKLLDKKNKNISLVKNINNLVAKLGNAQSNWVEQAADAGQEEWNLAMFNVQNIEAGMKALLALSELTIDVDKKPFQNELKKAARDAKQAMEALQKIEASWSNGGQKAQVKALINEAERYAGIAAEYRTEDKIINAYHFDQLVIAAATIAEKINEVEITIYTGVFVTSSQYEVSGVSDELDAFEVTIHNSLDESIDFAFDATLPEGWTIEAPESVTVAKGSKETVQVKVFPDQAAKEGHFTLDLSGAFGTSNSITPIQLDVNLESSLSLGLATVKEELKPGTELTVDFTNESKSVQDGEISLELPEWLLVEEDTVAYGPIEPGDSSSVTFTLADVTRSDFNDYDITMVATSNSGTIETTEKLNATLTKKGSATIDGDLSDWTEAYPIHLNKREQLGEKKVWTPEDLSAVVYTMWDEENYYIAAKVTDNVFQQSFTNSDVWRADGIQIGIDPLNDKTGGYNEDDSELGFTLTPEGEQVWRWYDGIDVDNNIVAGAELKVIQSGTETIYEMSVPMDQIGNLDLSAGYVYGMNVLINDDDGNGRTGWIEWTPGLGYGKVPASFDSFKLID